MAPSVSPNITQLLVAWNQGDQEALAQLTPLVYRELHRLARGYLAGERHGHVLQTTALVNEAFVRLIDWRQVEWQNRAHFFGVAATLMRHILVQFARANGRRRSVAGRTCRFPSPQPPASAHGTVLIWWRWMTH